MHRPDEALVPPPLGRLGRVHPWTLACALAVAALALTAPFVVPALDERSGWRMAWLLVTIVPPVAAYFATVVRPTLDRTLRLLASTGASWAACGAVLLLLWFLHSDATLLAVLGAGAVLSGGGVAACLHGARAMDRVSAWADGLRQVPDVRWRTVAGGDGAGLPPLYNVYSAPRVFVALTAWLVLPFAVGCATQSELLAALPFVIGPALICFLVGEVPPEALRRGGFALLAFERGTSLRRSAYRGGVPGRRDTRLIALLPPIDAAEAKRWSTQRLIGWAAASATLTLWLSAATASRLPLPLPLH